MGCLSSSSPFPSLQAPSRKDRCQLSLVFVPSSGDASSPTKAAALPSSAGSPAPAALHADWSVWELRLPSPAALQQMLPLLRATRAEARYQEQGARS